MTAPELPYNIDAERAVLGSVLLNRDVMVKLAGLVAPDDFHYEKHAQIYAAMLECYGRRVPPDFRTVSDRLRQAGQLEAIGGAGYLADLTDDAPHSYHAEHYAAEVARCAALRRVIDAGGRIAAMGYAESDAAEANAKAQALLTAAIGRERRATMATIGEVLDGIYTDLDATTLPAISTGLHDYDRATGGGLWPGELVVPAGRPGHGKSSLVGTIAANVARGGGRVLFFGLEMQRKEVARRLLSAESGIDSLKIRQRNLSDDERRRLNETMPSMSEWPLHLDDARQPMSEIRTKTLRVIAEHGPVALVVVDYIQLIPVRESRGSNRAQAIGEITRALKALAMESHCTVLAPSQLNREIEHRGKGETPIPTLSDLRESGDIEQDADSVVFVVRPELFEPGKDRNIGHLYIGKQRSGPPNVRIEVFYDAPRTRFTDLDKYRTPEGY